MKKITLFAVAVLMAGSAMAQDVSVGIARPTFTAADGTVTSGGWVTVVDAFCVSIGILILAAAASVLVSMSGVLTKSAIKK